MFMRKIAIGEYDRILDVLRARAVGGPLRSYSEVEIAVDGVRYRLALLPASGRKLMALQAVRAVAEADGSERHELLTKPVILSALLELWLSQIPAACGPQGGDG